MCGLVGGIGKSYPEIIEDNLFLLDRRGPDHSGFVHFNNGLAFGATRLAMTDPHERSNQPMVDASSGDAVIFNGEVYNFKSLRMDLINKGIKIETQSDTEVVLKYLTNFGVDCIKEFEGMFALAFYSRKQNKLFLARDYLGKKPLYYFSDGISFAFSSQISFIKKIIKSVSLDEKSLITYLGLGYVIDPDTMFLEIKSVGPSEIITIDLISSAIESRQKFIPNAISKPITSSITSVLNEALLRRVDGHSEFALSLSGGVDSTIILLQCLKLGLNVRPFTMSWPTSDKDKYNFDSRAAFQVTKKMGIKTENVEMPPADKIPHLLTEFIKAMDEPNSNPTALSMMVLYSRIAENNHRLVLTGDGSDEIFGGYKRYELTKKMSIFPKISLKYLNSFLLERNTDKELRNKFAFAVSSGNSSECWLFWHLLAGNDRIRKLNSDFMELGPPIYEGGLQKIYGSKSNLVSNQLFKDLNTWLPMESNRRLDRISMWYSIEARSPFQAENVIGVGYSAMQKTKFRFIQKELLRKEFRDLENLPINKSKNGFVSPLGYWLRSNSNMINDSLEILSKYLSLNKLELQLLRASPQSRNFNDFRFLWNLIVLGQWFEHNNRN